jgi:hypothetical protein
VVGTFMLRLLGTYGIVVLEPACKNSVFWTLRTPGFFLIPVSILDSIFFFSVIVRLEFSS